MAIKLMNYFFVLLLIINFRSASATEKILIEKYEHWNHPVLKVFKRYNINLYKVSYPKDGLCPAFYAKFKYSPDPRGPASNMFKNAYAEILKANSNFPYSLVDKEDDMRINVGWADKEKTTVVVDMDKASSAPTCKNGTAVKFIVDEQMKERIMKSPYKASLHGKDGKEMVAYLFADDEITKPTETYLCSTGEKVKSNVSTGHYYIYLFDVKSQSFYSTRVKVFKNFYQMHMGLNGADFFVMPQKAKSNSDVLFISQFFNCKGNYNEVYGFSNNDNSLKQFTFVGENRDDQLFGQVNKFRQYKSDLILSTHFNHKTYQYRLEVSNELGEVNIVKLQQKL